MNVEIGAEAAQFPEKEYINAIFVAVLCYSQRLRSEKSFKIFFPCLFSVFHQGRTSDSKNE